MEKLRYISIIIIILILSSFVKTKSSLGNLRLQQYSKIHLDLFVMSQCPFAVSAEKAIIYLLDTFKEEMDFELYFIAFEAQDAKEQIDKKDLMDNGEEFEDYGTEKCSGILQIDSNAQFYSLHGQSEVEEDIRQLVIMKHDPEKFLDYLFFRAEDYNTDDWTASAMKASLDIEHIKELVEGPEGETLLRENIKRAKGLNVDSSPTLFINGEIYKGRIEKNSLGRYICKHIAQLNACKEIPVCGIDQDCDSNGKVGLCLEPDTDNAKCICASPRKIMLTFIKEKKYQEKKEDIILLAAKAMFPKVSIQEIEYNCRESEALIDKYGLKVLPAYIFDKDVEKDIRFTRIKETLLKREDAYIINTSYLLKAYYINREERKGHLDLFVESLSESHNHLEYAIRTNPLLNKLPLRIHFFAKKIEDQVGYPPQIKMAMTKENGHSKAQTPFVAFSSTKGEKEIQEDIRQLCIAEKDPEKYKDYLACLNKNILEGHMENVWEICIQEAGIDSKIISLEEMNGRGIELLLKDIALADELGVTATPVVLVNNNILLRDFTIEMIEDLVSPQKVLVDVH